MTTEKHKCCGSVWPAGAYRSYPCHHNAKVERDGKWYCGTHDPVAIKEKQDKKKAESDARWKASQKLQAEAAAKRNEQERRAACFPELLEALKWHRDALDLGDVAFYERHGFNVSEVMPRTRAIVKKAEGEQQ
jgi:hypothetical protein